jgi:hypothetical protein
LYLIAYMIYLFESSYWRENKICLHCALLCLHGVVVHCWGWVSVNQKVKKIYHKIKIIKHKKYLNRKYWLLRARNEQYKHFGFYWSTGWRAGTTRGQRTHKHKTAHNKQWMFTVLSLANQFGSTMIIPSCSCACFSCSISRGSTPRRLLPYCRNH